MDHNDLPASPDTRTAPLPLPRTYTDFIISKTQSTGDGGFAPLWMPDWLYDFQQALIEWALRKGRAAIFADCGLGKTPMQLVWAQNIVQKTNGRVLIITPLAVAAQTCREAAKFGIEAGRPGSGARIIVTNYERLHHLSPDDFAGVVCDESSILKHFTGATQKQVTRFLLKMTYRLLCTATAAPNDYIELGTSSEALGYLNYSDMLSRFFKAMDNGMSMFEIAMAVRREKNGAGGDHYAKLSYRVAQSIGQYRLKGHAETAFWRWLVSWARACRKPSDLGFDDARFKLPKLTERHHVVEPSRPAEGMLFTIPAFGLAEERDERRRSLVERTTLVAQLVDHKKPAVVWCHMNDEGDALERAIPGAVQVSGNTPDEAKEEAYAAFESGQIRVLVNKPKIGAWGLNWYHCANVVTYASHSHEQYYQSIRRCWRFGQKKPVTVDIVSTVGEVRVRESMERKARLHETMFAELVKHMNEAMHIASDNRNATPVEVPPWA